MVRVETPGTYLLALRRRPAEASDPAPYSKGEAVLEIAGKVLRQPVLAGTESIELRIDLPVGDHFLEPLVSGQRQSGQPEGAYFCTITRTAH